MPFLHVGTSFPSIQRTVGFPPFSHSTAYQLLKYQKLTRD